MGLIKGILLDVGGVLLTNGWDHQLRMKTAEKFDVDYNEMNSRHLLVFDTYETGKLSFDDYLTRIIFYQDRAYSMQDVKKFIFDSVQPHEDVIDFFKEIKNEYSLKIGVVSNEGRELAVDRIQRFDLSSFVDFFVISSFVHFRKPDLDIYRLAIDISQVPPTQLAYIDDRQLLIEVAKTLGVNGIHHKGLASTTAALSLLLNKKVSVQ